MEMRLGQVRQLEGPAERRAQFADTALRQFFFVQQQGQPLSLEPVANDRLCHTPREAWRGIENAEFVVRCVEAIGIPARRAAVIVNRPVDGTVDAPYGRHRKVKLAHRHGTGSQVAGRQRAAQRLSSQLQLRRPLLTGVAVLHRRHHGFDRQGRIKNPVHRSRVTEGPEWALHEVVHDPAARSRRNEWR